MNIDSCWKLLQLAIYPDDNSCPGIHFMTTIPKEHGSGRLYPVTHQLKEWFVLEDIRQLKTHSTSSVFVDITSLAISEQV